MKKLWLILLVLLTMGIFACGGSDSGDPVTDTETPVDQTPDPGSGTVQVTAGQEEASTTTATKVDPDGGTIAVTNSSDPLYGLEIVVPQGATDEEITFTVSSATISQIDGLPTEAAARSRLIKIGATGSDDWNTFGMFDKAVKVTLPYTASSDTVAIYVYNPDGSLEPTGMAATNTTNNTITFWTRTFANAADSTATTSYSPTSAASSVHYAYYVAIGLSEQVWADWSNTTTSIDSGFRAATNGWYIPNYGSYYAASRGGNCFGMVGWAKYYYKVRATPALYSNYRDPEPTSTWLDDSTAIELASRVHNGMDDIWSQYVSQELDIQTASSLAVARSLVGALYITGSPALLGIYQEVNGSFTGGHAIMTYRADIDTSGNITFYIYDPNFPNDDTRRINYINGTGFQNYLSGTTAGNSSYSYNNISHVGFHVGLSDAVLAALKTSADQDFSSGSVFPTITITSITGKSNAQDVMSNTGTTSEGQAKYITTDTAVTIQGTVLGGNAQTAGSVVDNLRVLTPGGNYSTPIDNQAGGGTGEFEITIPLLHGENMIAFLAAKNGSFSHWAAFDMGIIESTASTAALTVTLSWGQDNSDVDLYVKEPDGVGKTGDIVYYAHREGLSTTNPYLDFDNTSGYGPEHYIVNNGMVTKYNDYTDSNTLYGDYTVGIHYYADHDDDYETTQPISWQAHWRYLAYCPAPCSDPDNQGFWVEGSTSGSLSTADSDQDGASGFNSGGSAWSSKWTISYPEPNPTDYEIPESHEIMLP